MKEGGPIANRIAIIEDDPPMREALCNAAKADDRLELIGAVGTHREGAALVEQGEYDVLLVDINLGHLQSFDLIRQSRDSWDAKIIVISVLGDEESVISAIESGAHGYLLKDGAFSDIAGPIEQVIAGDAPISPGVARHLLRRFRPAADIAVQEESGFLTPREQQVLVEFARGSSYKEVATKFDISIHTVGDYVKTLYRKLHVNSRGAAVSKAIRSGIIEV